MAGMYLVSGIGAILIILGFVALLTQRIYIDPQTNSPTEIEVPILGKMKSNYPALVFVFLGCVMVAMALYAYRESRTEWLIDGTMTSKTPGLDWQSGQLAIFPSDIDTHIDPATGKFSIKLAIQKNKSLEDVIERIQYSHPAGSMVIVPSEELRLKESGKPSKLSTQTPTSRSYNIQLEQMPQ